MRAFVCGVVVAFVSLIFLQSDVRADAWAETRVALVIGNSGYRNITSLDTPRNDARALARKLEEIGFDKVTLKLDIDAVSFRKELRKFARDAVGAGTALVYFSGHGIDVGGENFLIPVDAKLTHVDDLEFEAVELKKLLFAVNRATKLKLVIVDASRKHRFQKILDGALGDRVVGNGLARIDALGDDMLVAYAAKDGTFSANGAVKTSPYTAALLEQLDRPDVELPTLFDRVRDDVLAATDQRQEPVTYGVVLTEGLFLAASPQVSVQAVSADGIDDAADEEPTTRLVAVDVDPDSDGTRSKAFEIFIRAAQLGVPKAMFAVADMYRKGEGTARDMEEAARWYRQSAEADHVPAMHSFAIALANGHGVEADQKKAATYMIRALKKGSEAAVKTMTLRSGDFSKPFVCELQRQLSSEGVYQGAIDGALGPATKRAVRQLAGQGPTETAPEEVTVKEVCRT